MTPEERELVRGLFDRLIGLESRPRDPDAERLIREGLSRAPNAAYSLVQTVLLQDEALRAANARIEELESSEGPARARESSGSFLNPQRGKWNTGGVLGGGAPSPPDVPPAGSDRPMGLPPSLGGSDRPMGLPPGFGGSRGAPDAYGAPAGGPAGPSYGGPSYGGPAGGPAGGAPGGGPSGGGSFLGTAAAVAAGVIGGGLLMGGIKSALGGGASGGASSSGGAKSPFADAFEQLSGGKGASGSSAGGDLARDAGLQDVGQGSRQGAWGERAAQSERDDNAGSGKDDADFEGSEEDDVDYDDESFGDEEDI